VAGQRLANTGLLGPRRLRPLIASGIRLRFLGLFLGLLCFPEFFEQSQLLFGKLLALAAALGLQQFAQQTAVLIFLGALVLELRANSPTILRSALASSGSELRSIGGTCFQPKGNNAAFQEKTGASENVLLIDAPVALPPCGCAQIDAAQQRPEFFGGDLHPARAGLARGDGVGALLPPLGPNGESIAVSSRPREFHPSPSRNRA